MKISTSSALTLTVVGLPVTRRRDQTPASPAAHPAPDPPPPPNPPTPPPPPPAPPRLHAPRPSGLARPISRPRRPPTCRRRGRGAGGGRRACRSRASPGWSCTRAWTSSPPPRVRLRVRRPAPFPCLSARPFSVSVGPPGAPSSRVPGALPVPAPGGLASPRVASPPPWPPVRRRRAGQPEPVALPA